MKRGFSLLLGIAAVAGAPALLMLPGGDPTPGTVRKAEQRLPVTEQLLRKLARPEWDAFCGNAAAIIESARLHAAAGDAGSAERWLRWGAAEVRQPAVMLYYGDTLAASRPEEAEVWYRRAAAAVTDPSDPAQAAFLNAVRSRLREGEAHAERP